MAGVDDPVGFRFHPTGEELVNHFLRNKIQGHDFNHIIPEINICKYEPWDLPGLSVLYSDDEWFYFTKPNYKFRKNGSRATKRGSSQVNRATKRGYWKITGKECEIRARDQSKAVIGKKRTLTFHEGKVRSSKRTCWVIHEYYIPKTLLPNDAKQDFVLCHLKKKDESSGNGARDEGASPESPQSDAHFSSNLRGNSLHANAGGTNLFDMEDDTEFFKLNFGDLDDFFEERTDPTLNQSSVGGKLLGAAEDTRLPVASSLSEQDKDVGHLFMFSRMSDASVNKPSDINHVQSVTEETEPEPYPILLQEPQATFSHSINCITLVTDESSKSRSKGRKSSKSTKLAWRNKAAKTAWSFDYGEELQANEKHRGEDQCIEQGKGFSLPVDSSYPDELNLVCFSARYSGEDGSSVNTAATIPSNTDQPCPSFPVEQQGSNMHSMTLATEENLLEKMVMLGLNDKLLPKDNK